MKKMALFENPLEATSIVPLSGVYGENQIFMKRDDMLPFSFGGNKVRKAAEFYKEITETDTDVIVTYGSNSSNHCRIIANMAAAMGLSCHIISPEENREKLYNTRLVEQFGAVIETCPVSEVSATIDRRLDAYRKEGKHPYFIMGGGHGNPGTEGYVKAYREIVRQEQEKGIHFDYIFHASGTGATQAGLVCGMLLSGDRDRKIVGISIAREEERGREAVKESILEYLSVAGTDENKDLSALFQEESLIFTDAYRCGGYGKYTPEIKAAIASVMKDEGIPMDTTYVGKAFYGMLQYLNDHGIKNKRVLFLHTGGAPLYFDRL